MLPVEDLASIKEDMIAFIAGHGLRTMRAFIGEDVPSILFEDDTDDGWKTFVEHAASAGAGFLTISEVLLEPEDIAMLVGRLRSDDLDRLDSQALEDAQDLMQHTGHTGYLQLGFAHQGVVFLYETATEWYDQFQDLMDTVNGLGGILTDDSDDD